MSASRSSWWNACGRLAVAVPFIIYAPVIGLLALAILVFGGRPVFTVETVALHDGSTVRLHRFRTRGGNTTLFNAFGRWMSRTHIENLPAFWSVLYGDISVIDAWRLCVQPLFRQT